MSIHIRECSDSEAWDNFVDCHPQSSIYHRYAWRDYFSSYFRKDCHYLAAVDNDEVLVGVLPLVGMRSRIFGSFLVSLPFVNYGGILSLTTDAGTALVEAAVNIAVERNASHIEFRHAGSEFDLPYRDDKVAMVLELPDSCEELGRNLGSKRRSQIRRSLRENPEIKFSQLSLLDDFYAVFSRNMRDLGTPVYSKGMFQFLLKRFPENTAIVVISVRNEPAAAAFLIFDEHRVEVPWASTVRNFNRIGVNMLLYWEVLRYAIESGHRTFDFGRSTVNSGTYRFKKQWGAQPLELKWHYWLAGGGDPPKLNPDNPKFKLAIRAWQKLPLPVANFFGPYLVRHLP